MSISLNHSTANVCWPNYDEIKMAYKTHLQRLSAGSDSVSASIDERPKHNHKPSSRSSSSGQDRLARSRLASVETCYVCHDDVLKWKHFPRYWPFVRRTHQSPVNSPHKGQWRGALKISLICTWIKGWVNNREAGDLRRHRAHFDVTIMVATIIRRPKWYMAPKRTRLLYTVSWHTSFFQLESPIATKGVWILILLLCLNMVKSNQGMDDNHINHNDVIKWKHLPHYWPFVRGFHRSPVNSPHKGQWRGALMFSLICAWINGWVNKGEAGDLRRQRGHYDVIVMY